MDETWAIVELMGHVKLAGKLTEEEKFGSKLGRLDIPATEPCTCPNASRGSVEAATVECSRCQGSGVVETWQTKYFGGASVYRISIVTEEVARHVGRQTAPAPVSPWDFPRTALPAPAASSPAGGDVIDAEFDDMPDSDYDD